MAMASKSPAPRRAPLEVIAERSRLSEMAFIGMAVSQDEGEGDLLARYAGLVNALQGNLVLTKSWHDLSY